MNKYSVYPVVDAHHHLVIPYIQYPDFQVGGCSIGEIMTVNSGKSCIS